MCGFMSIEMIKRRYINNIFLYILKTDKKKYLTDKKLQMILVQESLFNLNATSPKQAVIWTQCIHGLKKNKPK